MKMKIQERNGQNQMGYYNTRNVVFSLDHLMLILNAPY